MVAKLHIHKKRKQRRDSTTAKATRQASSTAQPPTGMVKRRKSCPFAGPSKNTKEQHSNTATAEATARQDKEPPSKHTAQQQGTRNKQAVKQSFTRTASTATLTSVGTAWCFLEAVPGANAPRRETESVALTFCAMVNSCTWGACVSRISCL